MSFQQLTVLGRLGRDPETFASKNGKDVCKFSVATSEKRGGEEKTLWLNTICFGKTAEIAQAHLKKGRQVLLVGRVELEEYEAKDGTKKSSLSLVVDRLTFISEGGGKDVMRTSGGDAPPDVGELPF